MISAVCGPWVGWKQSEITLRGLCIAIGKKRVLLTLVTGLKHTKGNNILVHPLKKLLFPPTAAWLVTCHFSERA
jgi:hypothetical protein